MNRLVARQQIAAELSAAMLGVALVLAWPPVLVPVGAPAVEVTDPDSARLTFTLPGTPIDLTAAPIPAAEAPTPATEAATDAAAPDAMPPIDGPATTIQAQASVTPGVRIVRAPAVASWKLSLSEDTALYSAMALGDVGTASAEETEAVPAREFSAGRPVIPPTVRAVKAPSKATTADAPSATASPPVKCFWLHERGELQPHCS